MVLERALWLIAGLALLGGLSATSAARVVAPRLAVDAAWVLVSDRPFTSRDTLGAHPLDLPNDPWGSPWIARVAPAGIDAVYSVGPNGLDEHLRGDDLLVRADTAPARLLASSPWIGLVVAAVACWFAAARRSVPDLVPLFSTTSVWLAVSAIPSLAVLGVVESRARDLLGREALAAMGPFSLVDGSLAAASGAAGLCLVVGALVVSVREDRGAPR